MPTAVVILAAGQGTRMNSDLPKVLHRLAAAPLIAHVLAAARSLDPERVVVVTGHGAADVKAAVAETDPETVFALQAEQRGTGHAVLQAGDALAGFEGDVLVLYGDTPFVRSETLRAMLDARAAGAAVVALGFEAADPGRYGRLVLGPDGALAAIVEAGDADPATLAIRLCNSGVIAADRAMLFSLLADVGDDNANGEIYLTDVVGIARARGLTAAAITCPESETLGVNSRADLAAAEAAFQARARAEAMANGATLSDPATVWFALDTYVGRDVVIGQNVVFDLGVTVESGATIKPFCHFAGCHISRGAEVGPFARLRPGAELAEHVHIGNFVEVKNVDRRRRRQDQPSRLRRRRGRRRPGQHRGRRDRVQLRRGVQTSHPHRRRRLRRLERGAGGAGPHRRPRRHRRRLDDHARRAGRGARPRPRPPGHQAGPRDEAHGAAPRAQGRTLDEGSALMCGIVGILGTHEVAPLILESLKRLEYRGYDSAGIATVHEERLGRRVALGKLIALSDLLVQDPIRGHSGIGHTRWATHGAPSERNAHPHVAGRVAVVHNGIVENFRDLRAELEAEGRVFGSETDTEVVAHLADRALGNGGDPLRAVRETLAQLEGAFALVFLFEGHGDLMIAARQGSPLAIGYGDGEMFVGLGRPRARPAHPPHRLSRGGRPRPASPGPAPRCSTRTEPRSSARSRRRRSRASTPKRVPYKHFMAKEIHEQPTAIAGALAHYLNPEASLMVLNNQEAKINVGQQVPISTGSSSIPLSGGTATTGSFAQSNTIQYKDTGVTLEVTPRVNANGMVIMEIKQIVSSVVKIPLVGSTETEDNPLPLIKKRLKVPWRYWTVKR